VSTKLSRKQGNKKDKGLLTKSAYINNLLQIDFRM